MEVEVHVALHCQELDGPISTPRRPVVRGKHEVEIGAEEVDGLGEVAGPPMGVTNLCATDRQDVVQGVRGVLRRAKRVELGEVEVHLGRSLGARGDLEDHPNAVEHKFLAGGLDLDGRSDERRLTE